MNERIRELATQADIWCDQNYPNSEFYDIHWEEKFAELIVRECAEICLEANDHKNILRHFGVKE